MTSETRRTGPDQETASASSTRSAESTQYLDPRRPASPGNPLDQPTTAVRPTAPRTQGEPPSDPPRPPAPATEPAEPLSPLWVWGSPVLAVLAVVLLPLAAATTNLDDLGGWGLAAALSPFAWLSLALAVAACVVELWSKRPRIPMLGAATGVLILCSFGMPSVVMPQARFTTAWLIGGFVDALSGTGVPPTGVDARFYWPAFFAQWAWIRDAAGVDNLDLVLRWFPPAVVAVWAIGVYALARSMLGGTRAPWVAAWLFLGLNWIEQDYFSPQATAIVLLLTVLTFALGPLATRRTDTAGVAGWPRAHKDAPRLPRWRRWLVSAMTPPNSPTLPARQLLLIYFSASLCLIAIAPTHQLTPFAIIGQLVVLAVVGRFRGRGLVIIGIIAVVIYILIAGRDFWMSQISMITGGSDEGGAIEAGFFERLQGDTGQLVVKLLRAFMPVVTWLLAIAGAWVYWKRRRDLVPILLAVVPMGMAAVQSYGGELLLRVILYGLPVLAILGVDALRAFVRADRRREIALAVGMLLLFPVLVLIRGGNDAYMDVTTEDVTMTRAAYDAAPPDALVLPLANVGPYQLEGVGEHNKSPGVKGCDQLANDPLPCIDKVQPQTILFYKSIEKQGVVLNGEAPGWSTKIRDQLIASGQYRATYQNGFDAVLVRVAEPLAPAPAPAPQEVPQ